MTAEVVKNIQWSENSKLRYFNKDTIDSPKDIKTKDKDGPNKYSRLLGYIIHSYLKQSFTSEQLIQKYSEDFFYHKGTQLYNDVTYIISKLEGNQYILYYKFCRLNKKDHMKSIQRLGKIIKLATLNVQYNRLMKE